MEVTAATSIMTNSSSNDSNTNNNLNNSNNNGNGQLIDKDNLQSHQQRAQFIMSTKGINDCIGNSFVNPADKSCQIGATTFNESPRIESVEDNPAKLSSDDSGENHLPNVVRELLDKILSEIESQMSSNNHQPGSTTLIDSEIKNQGLSRDLTLPLNITSSNQTAESPKRQPLDLSPDEATSDLVIDADIPSNDSQGNTPKTDQSEPDALDESTQDLTEKPFATEILTTNPVIENEISTQAQPPSNVNNQADKVVEEQPAEAKKSIEQDLNINTASEEVPLVNDDDQEDLQEEKTKDIVTLRNLEITPPPPPPENHSIKKESDEEDTSKRVQGQKRKRSTASESTTESNQTTEGGRSKRQRTQTKLFQAGQAKVEVQQAPKNPISRKSRTSTSSVQKCRKKSTGPSISDKNLSNTQNCIVQQPLESQDVIFYEKNDYLAVRNEENTFYLCQLAENVKVDRPLMKIRWLDTRDDGKTYFLTSQYDKVYQKSIIMPVTPNILKSGKKNEQLFSLDDQVKANIMDRLSKSLSAQTELIPSQGSEQLAPDT